MRSGEEEVRERRGEWSRRVQDCRLSESSEGRWERSWVSAGGGRVGGSSNSYKPFRRAN